MDSRMDVDGRVAAQAVVPLPAGLQERGFLDAVLLGLLAHSRPEMPLLALSTQR